VESSQNKEYALDIQNHRVSEKVSSLVLSPSLTIPPVAAPPCASGRPLFGPRPRLLAPPGIVAPSAAAPRPCPTPTQCTPSGRRRVWRSSRHGGASDRW
jgi:hypothetical protein